MKITMDAIKEAVKAGYPVTVEINGEFYDLEATANNNDFMDGVKFTMAVIEDRQAHFNHCLGYKPTKKAILKNIQDNEHVKGLLNYLDYITTEVNSFNGFYCDYVHGNLWRLDK